jgi:hypothetical protein
MFVLNVALTRLARGNDAGIDCSGGAISGPFTAEAFLRYANTNQGPLRRAMSVLHRVACNEQGCIRQTTATQLSQVSCWCLAIAALSVRSSLGLLAAHGWPLLCRVRGRS